MVLNGLDLFSGIGGITLGLSEWVRPVAYCEIERYAQGVLLSRMGSGELPVAPIWDDIKTLDGKQFRGKVDIVYGGFPCQPYSKASRGRKPQDEMRIHFQRIVSEVRPRFVFAENVSQKAFEGLFPGYEKNIIGLSAADVDAPHIRRRYWLFGHTYKNRQPDGTLYVEASGVPETTENIWKQVEPDDLRMVDGLPNRVVRIASLGNAVVPLQTKVAFEYLLKNEFKLK